MNYWGRHEQNGGARVSKCMCTTGGRISIVRIESIFRGQRDIIRVVKTRVVIMTRDTAHAL